MEEKEKEKNNEAAATTTSSPLQKSDKIKIEKLKKSLKASNNIPKKSIVISQNEDKTPIKSEVSGQSDQRSTTWTCVFYPESAPGNWIYILK